MKSKKRSGTDLIYSLHARQSAMFTMFLTSVSCVKDPQLALEGVLPFISEIYGDDDLRHLPDV